MLKTTKFLLQNQNYFHSTTLKGIIALTSVHIKQYKKFSGLKNKNKFLKNKRQKNDIYFYYSENELELNNIKK